MWLLYIVCALIGIPLLFIAVLAVSALCVDTKKRYRHNSRYYRALLNISTAIAIFLCRIKIHTSGFEKLPKDGHFFIVCNHRSNFDPILTWYLLRKYDIAYLSKADNFKVPIFGRLIRRCCFMEMNRGSPKESMMTINSAAELLMDGEVSIGIYPEGTRSKSGKLLPFHNGVFITAQKASVPTVVSVISGTEQIHKNTPFRKTDVFFTVLDVIKPCDIKNMQTCAIGEHVRNQMEEALGREAV